MYRNSSENIKISLLILLRKIIGVYCKCHTQHKYKRTTRTGEEFHNVPAQRTYKFHWSLKGQYQVLQVSSSHIIIF
jgi:hypothetical protein